MPLTPSLAYPAPHDLLATALLQSTADFHPQLVGKRIWLALSGGRDSLVMASVCLRLYGEGRLPFCPQFIHVNHGIQTANDAWAEQVSQWANDNGSQCVVVKAQVDGTDEQAARHARYTAIAKHINRHDVLMTAHHANDQSETLLMRLFAGTGVKGLSGMAVWSCRHITIPTNNTNNHNDSNLPEQPNQHDLSITSTKPIHLWRPWLSVSRDAISGYAKHHALPYIDDPTNITGTNVRSWLRRKLLPVIEQRYPQAISNIARFSELMSDADAILQEVYHNDKLAMVNDFCIYSNTQPPHSNSNHDNQLIVDSQLDLSKFGGLSTARQRSLLYHWLHEQDTRTPSKQRTDDILALAWRDDNDHQTELHWQGAVQHYVIKRHRHILHRLQASWLNWLQTPVADSVFASMPTIDPIHANQANTLTLRTAVFAQIGQMLTWQLILDLPSINLPNLVQNLDWYNADWQTHYNNIFIRVRPLHKTDRLSIYQPPDAKTDIDTGRFRPPQSGKKLLQSLGIASWLRQSVLLVEAKTYANSESQPASSQTVPLWLICPWQQWALQPCLANTDIQQIFVLT